MNTLNSYSLNIKEIDDYLHRIFDLQSDLRDKDQRIEMLEFELSLERGVTKYLSNEMFTGGGR